VLRKDEDGRFQIGLMQAGSMQAVCVALHETDESVIADWRALGRRLGLPLAVETADDGVHFLNLPMGPSPRQRGSLTARRRSRFAARRQLGVLGVGRDGQHPAAARQVP
jgi:hypothetical protein